MDSKGNDVCYWGLDSTFWIHRKMFIRSIFELQQSKSFKGYYEIGCRIIYKVEVQGVVVSVDEREKLVTYKVDDGTGIISCCSWRDTIKDLFILGQTVTIQGKISEYRNEKQLTVNSITIEDNVNAECLFWLDVVHLSKTVYQAPFVVPDSNCLNSSQSRTKKYLLDLIEKWSIDGKLHFSFNELYSNPEVQENIKSMLHTMKYLTSYLYFLIYTQALRKVCMQRKIIQVMSGIFKARHQTTDGNIVLREMLVQLEKQGYVFYKAAKRDLYEIITHEKHLQPAIVKAIKDICKDSPHSGAHISRITDVVHSSQNLGRVPCVRIIDSLKRLIDNSEVYQKSDQVYCLV